MRTDRTMCSGIVRVLIRLYASTKVSAVAAMKNNDAAADCANTLPLAYRDIDNRFSVSVSN